MFNEIYKKKGDKNGKFEVNHVLSSTFFLYMYNLSLTSLQYHYIDLYLSVTLFSSICYPGMVKTRDDRILNFVEKMHFHIKLSLKKIVVENKSLHDFIITINYKLLKKSL